MMWIESIHFFLMLAMASLVGLLFLCLLQYQKKPVFDSILWVSMVRQTMQGFCWVHTLALVAVMFAFWDLDYSLKIVWKQSHDALPWWFRLTALWGGGEGSWLLWVWLLTCVLVAHLRTMPGWVLVKKPMAVLVPLMICLGASVYGLFFANPLERLLPIPPAVGQDLNPLLQDLVYLIHPPILYLGLITTVVPFTKAMLVLSDEKLLKTSAWVQSLQQWALMAWVFLSAGIGLGSYWAYRELGWGGWWFWDPVENGSFIPWLCLTGLLHAGRVPLTPLRKMMLLLSAVTCFLTVLMATLLVRSGWLVSVHAFADNEWGAYFLLAYWAGLSLWGYGYWLSRCYQMKGQFSVPSGKQAWLLFQNYLSLITALLILTATVYPLLSTMIDWSQVSLGPEYFEQVLWPFWLAALLGMIASHWQPQSGALVLSVSFISLVSLLLGLWFNGIRLLDLGGHVLLIGLVMVLVVQSMVGKQSWVGRGVHGLVAILMGCVVINQCFETAEQIKLTEQGEAVNSGVYVYQLKEVKAANQDNYQRFTAMIERSSPNHSQLIMPEIRYYPSRDQWQSKPMIENHGWYDDYWVLSKVGKRDYFLRAIKKPMQSWIWLVMCCLTFMGAYQWLFGSNTNKQDYDL